MQETKIQSLDWENPMEKQMATQFSILTRRIQWTEEPDGLYSPWGHKEADTIYQLNHRHIQKNVNWP